MRPRGDQRSELHGGRKLRLHVSRGDFSSFEGTRFNLAEWFGEGLKVGVFEMQEVEDRGLLAPENSGFSLTDHGTQELFDQLWHLGFRPTAPRNEAPGVIEAMKDHIGDLRKVAFKQMHIAVEGE